MLKPGGRLGLTVWGHIKASPGAWALTSHDEPPRRRAGYRCRRRPFSARIVPRRSGKGPPTRQDMSDSVQNVLTFELVLGVADQAVSEQLLELAQRLVR